MWQGMIRQIFFAMFFLMASCSTVSNVAAPINVSVLLKDAGPVRALAVDGDKIWFGGMNKYGWIDRKSGQSRQWAGDSDAKVDFRSIAQTNSHVFVLNAGTPAWLFRIDKETQAVDTVYTESAKTTFYDSMQFRDNSYGIALGDPVDGAFSVLETSDGGITWKKRPISNSPKVEDGEAAFAASNSNLNLKEDKIYIVSGGKRARFFASDGAGWKSYETPIAQGKTMTGIFTADFYDEKCGIVSGGDYENQKENKSNKAITSDGGHTWSLVADGEAFGYASCVQYAPGGKGKIIASVGPNGLWVSRDGGKNWKQLYEYGGWYTIRFIDKNFAVAAGRTDIHLIEFK